VPGQALSQPIVDLDDAGHAADVDVDANLSAYRCAGVGS